MTYESSHWRQRLHTVIFESDTRAGRAFDVALIICILASIMVVMLESIAAFDARWHREFVAAEMGFTVLFTIEYILRLLAVRRPLAYARSVLGIIDLLAIVPTWLTFFVPGAHLFLTVRILRLLRVFRVLKLTEYLSEAGVLVSALRASRRKISVFLFTVITLVVLMGALIYIVEGPANGFTSIPLSMYWAIVTLTTVGYGDLAPQTALGKLVASLDHPARAIRFASAGIGSRIDVAAAVHTGEGQIGEHDVSGPAVEMASAVAVMTPDGEVWVSSTVHDLVAGSGLAFRSVGRSAETDAIGSRELFALLPMTP